MINKKRSGFTLIEVLISITLLSLVLMALYKSADILRNSNLHLFQYLERSSSAMKGSQTLYKDIMHSDHNITIVTEESKYHRLILNKTTHSLYGLGSAKVTWLIAKEEKSMLRIEGGAYAIPLRGEEHVEIDVIAKNVERFNIYKSKKKDKILAVIKIGGQEPQSFMVQNIPLLPPKNQDRNVTNSANGAMGGNR